MQVELRHVLQVLPFSSLAIATDGLIVASTLPGVLAGSSLRQVVAAPYRDTCMHLIHTLNPQHDLSDIQLCFDGDSTLWHVRFRGLATHSEPIMLLMCEQQKPADQRNLEDIIAEKELLLSEIHHRVKNNMQLISSMLMIQTHYIDSPPFKQVVKECQDRIRAMSLVHESLYQSHNWRAVQFLDYATTILNRLALSYQSPSCVIQYELIMPSITLPIDYAISLGLVLNELITNAYKYAFTNRSEGHIRVEMTELSANRYELSVHDNGVGFPNDIELSRSHSMGMQLITTLCRQLSAELTLEKRNGTRFVIVFSIMKQEEA